MTADVVELWNSIPLKLLHYGLTEINFCEIITPNDSTQSQPLADSNSLLIDQDTFFLNHQLDNVDSVAVKHDDVVVPEHL